MQRPFDTLLMQSAKVYRPPGYRTASIYNLYKIRPHSPIHPTRSLSVSSHRLGKSSASPHSLAKRKKSPYHHPPPSRTTNPFRDLPETPPTSDSPIPFWWSLALFGFAASIGYVAVLFVREPPTETTPSSDSDSTSASNSASTAPTLASIPADVSDRYHQTAATFDADVSFFESTSGLNRLRKKLVKAARGSVLEVSAGTGRNLAYYDFGPDGVRELTLLDQAGEMIAVAEQKAAKELPAADLGCVKFLTQSALDPVPAVPAGGFDFVVQTMGLCSTGDPVRLVRTIAGLVKVGEGRILLLEHGKGWFGWLNRALDRWAPAHADRHGCWWNRDIGEIVREATEGEGAVLEGGRRLEVVRMKRHHLGTTWWVELRVTDEGGKVGKA